MIRPAQSADAGGIAEIWNPVIRDTAITFNSVPKTPADVDEMLAERAAAGHAAFVAEEDGTLLGFAHYSQFRGGVGYACTLEHTVILAQAARGRGLGRDLLGAVEDHACDAGGHTMFAGISSANPQARRFHARLGYRDVVCLTEVGFKFGRWYDLYLMAKRLDDADSPALTR